MSNNASFCSHRGSGKVTLTDTTSSTGSRIYPHHCDNDGVDVILVIPGEAVEVRMPDLELEYTSNAHKQDLGGGYDQLWASSFFCAPKR